MKKRVKLASLLSLSSILAISTIPTVLAFIEPSKPNLIYKNLSNNNNETYEVSNKSEGNYLAHPDYISKMENDKLVLYVFYVQGHGKGRQIAKKSYDLGKTWINKLNLPNSFNNLKETPTLHELNFVDEDGKNINKRKYISVSGRPGWNYIINRGEGFDVPLSDDLDNWADHENFFGPLAKRKQYYLPKGNVDAIVAFSSVSQLYKDGKKINRWKCLFHSYNGIIYQTELYFNDSEQLEFTRPTELKIINNHPNDFAEPCIIQNPNNLNEYTMIVRSIDKNKTSGYVLKSSDGMNSWEFVGKVNENLGGDRHKVVYDKDGNLYITFRQVSPKKFNNFLNKKLYSIGPMLWKGKYEDILTGEGKLYKIQHIYKSKNDNIDDLSNADNGYAGIIIHDNKLLYVSYGKFKNNDLDYTGIFSKIIDVLFL